MSSPATTRLEPGWPGSLAHSPSSHHASLARDPHRAAIARRVVLGVVWIACAAYVLHYLRHGWVPHDEGTLAQSAERVLRGQLPHRDFDDVYTGGLSMLDAAAFRVLGASLLSLRLVLYAAFLLWVPALYYIALRFAAPVAAGASVLLAVAWSLPNYSAAMPSWYNLFLATAGVAALLRHVETGRRRWLVAAGACGGVSCLVKIVGVYYIGAALLFLLYREQCLARDERSGTSRRTWGYSLLATTGVAAYLAVLVALLWRRLGAAEAVHFLVPGALLGALLLRHEWAAPPSAGADRFRTLAALVAPFVAGVLLPVLLFLIPYLATGGVGALVRGVFVTPAKRLQFAAVHPPMGARLLVVAPVLLLAGIIPLGRARLSWVTRGLVGACLALVLLVSDQSIVYWSVWNSMRALVPLLAAAGVWTALRDAPGLGTVRRQQLVALLAVCVLTALVQFPFAAPVYFFYVAPLVALAGLAVIAVQPRPARVGPAALCAFYIAFAALRIHPGFIHAMGYRFLPDDQTVRLDVDRGGIDVTAADAASYRRLVRLLRAHASGGYTFATPDCPQVYFLSGLRNPTRTLYDFFDDPAGRTARVLGALDAHRVTAIALARHPEFSGPVPADLERALEARYPRSETVGDFMVRWRE